MLEEDQCGVAAADTWPVCHLEAQSRSHKRRSSHDEALQEAREAHQQTLKATHRLELDMEKLSQEVEKHPTPMPCSLSGSDLQSRSL